MLLGSYTTSEYATANRISAACERPRVLVLGSSRAREAIVMPLLREKFAPDVAPRQCRNYGLSSARGPEVYSVLKMLRDAGKMPDVLILGVTPFELAEHHDEPPIGYLLGVGDFFTNPVSMAKAKLIRAIPTACHALADRHIRTLWLREAIRLRGNAFDGLLGGLSNTQTTYIGSGQYAGKEHSLLTNPVSMRGTNGFMSIIELGGEYHYASSHIQCVINLLRMATECGCKTVVVELPVSRVLKDTYPSNMYKDFVNFYEYRCRLVGVPFIRLKDMGVEMGDDCMYDVSHLN